MAMHFIKNEEKFETHGLRNDLVEVCIVPELGSRILSLRDLRSGREWMDRPIHSKGKALFKNKVGDDFGLGTFAGADECLPTVNKMEWKGRDLPCHGEVWAMSWLLDEEALSEGKLTTSVNLPISPLSFCRTISLEEEWVTMDYEVTNLGEEEEFFLWAHHPLYAIREGDRLELPSEVKEVLVTGSHGVADSPSGTRWSWPSPRTGVYLDQLDFGGEGLAKFFAGPLREGFAAISNTTRGERLELHWNPHQNPWLGLWLTRGAFRGMHHLALEPTNGRGDDLASVLQNTMPSVPFSPLLSGESRLWQLRLRIAS